MNSVLLKLIALVTMTVDHFGAVVYWIQGHRETATIMRLFGRIAFPVYVFLIAVGMLKTKSREKYLARLAAFAFVSFVPFSMFFNVVFKGNFTAPVYFETSYINVFFTLFLGAAAIYFYDLLRKLMKDFLSGIPGYAAGLLCAAACIKAAELLHTDYGKGGVGVIFLTYLAMSVYDNRFFRVLPLAAWAFWQYSGSNTNGMYFAFGAVLLLLLYNGKPGSEKLRGKLKFIFYAYYPAHLLAAYLLAIALRR